MTLRGHRLARRFAPVLAVLVLVLGVLRAGSTSFYCPTMNVTLSHACCAERAETETGGEPTADRPPCCERRTLGPLPDAVGTVRAQPPRDLGPSLAIAATLARRSANERSAAASVPTRSIYGSTGPPRARSRNRQMVFLI